MIIGYTKVLQLTTTTKPTVPPKEEGAINTITLKDDEIELTDEKLQTVVVIVILLLCQLPQLIQLSHQLPLLSNFGLVNIYCADSPQDVKPDSPFFITGCQGLSPFLSQGVSRADSPFASLTKFNDTHFNSYLLLPLDIVCAVCDHFIADNDV